MSIKQNFPAIKPTLNLDFANSRAVDSRIQFTRASAATVTDGQGILQTVSNNKPRIDFDANTGVCRGLLIEEQRTNVFPYSADLKTDPWYKTNVILAPNSAIAPDGTQSALKVIATAGNGRHTLDILTAIVSSATLTVSCYAKSAGRNILHMHHHGGGIFGRFDLSNGTVIAVTSGPHTAKIEPVGNGWYRCSLTGYDITSTVAGGTYTTIGNGDPAGTDFTGDGISGIYIWGAQLESGSFATSYIPSIVSFTSRASSATYFDFLGVLRTAGTNQARYGYGYDSATQKWVSQGLILEPAATNLIIRSDCQANWSIPNIGYTYSTQTTAPDGSTIYSINKNSTYQLMRLGGLFDTASISYPATYTLSFWAKTLSGTGTLTWDIGDSTTATGAASLTTTWQRFTYTFTASSASTFPSGGFIDLTMPDNSTYAIWGVQLETGGTATSLVQTFGATATRAADVSSSAATTRAADDAIIKASEFTKFSSSTECTLYGEATTISGPALTNGRPALVTISNNLDRDTHRFILRRNDQLDDVAQSGFNYRLATVINGSSYNIDHATLNGAQPEWEDYAVHKTIFSVSTTTQQAYGDGVSAGITSISIPNFDKFNQLEIGNGGSSRYWNGHIRKITYYNKKLTDTQAQTLTA